MADNKVISSITYTGEGNVPERADIKIPADQVLCYNNETKKTEIPLNNVITWRVL